MFAYDMWNEIRRECSQYQDVLGIEEYYNDEYEPAEKPFVDSESEIAHLTIVDIE